MYNLEVSNMTKALGLEREIVGVRFLYNWVEYEDTKCENYGKITRFCLMTKNASNGEHFKCKLENFGCGRSRKALGLDENDKLTMSGQVFYSCSLYSTRAVAKKAQDATLFIEQELYGIEIGPLNELAEADIVIFYANAYQMMRIIQGYTYNYGPYKGLNTVGNQGVCSDLCARPFVTNDMNISFLCEGARRACKFNHDVIGVGLPIGLFKGLVDGVLKTLDLIENDNEKEKILGRLNSKDELGVAINMGNYYGVACGKWYKKKKEDEKRYEEFLKAEASNAENS